MPVALLTILTVFAVVVATGCSKNDPRSSEHQREQELFDEFAFEDLASPVESEVFPSDTFYRFSVLPQFDGFQCDMSLQEFVDALVIQLRLSCDAMP